MSLTIGGITVPHAAILAPMSGVTDMPFRRAVRRAGGGLVVTEMVASAAILREVRSEMRKLRVDTVSEVPLSVQLAGWDPQIMADAARIALSTSSRLRISPFTITGIGTASTTPRTAFQSAEPLYIWQRVRP